MKISYFTILILYASESTVSSRNVRQSSIVSVRSNEIRNMRSVLLATTILFGIGSQPGKVSASSLRDRDKDVMSSPPSMKIQPITRNASDESFVNGLISGAATRLSKGDYIE